MGIHTNNNKFFGAANSGVPLYLLKRDLRPLRFKTYDVRPFVLSLTSLSLTSLFKRIPLHPGPRFRFLFFFTTMLFLIGCSNPKKQMIKDVVKLEVQVNKNFNKDNATKLIIEYDKFITTFPEDTSRKGYIVKAAEVSFLQQDPANALKFINLFLKDYPDDPRAPELQFKKGMVYDLLLHDGLRAVAEYTVFIKKYPANPMRQDVEYAIFAIQDPDGYMKEILKSQDTRDTLIN